MAIRLMLADDHRLLRESLRRSMADEGFEILGEAADGEEAVRLAGQLRPDVILMDVSMPEMDGVDATRKITSEHPDVRVIMLTMHNDGEVVDRALKAGATGYLVKDCTIEQIATAVRMAADGETAMSRDLALSMLSEVKRIDSKGPREEERIITKREEEVLQLIADGCSTPEVAARLYISQKTVKNHLASIYEKLDARDRTQAVLQAVRMGIVHLR